MSNGVVSEKGKSFDSHGEALLITRLPNPASPTTTSFPRTTTPTLFPSRLGASPDGQTIHQGMKLSKNLDYTAETRPRSHSRSNEKGKEPIRGDIDTTTHFGREHYVPHYNGGSAYTYDRTRPATADGNFNGRNKFRGSLLVAASDALNFKFGRRRPTVRQPPMPVILPDVIEISAPRADEEVEERNRLREMAAQAIGLGPFMVSPDTQSRDDSATDEDDEDQPLMLDGTEIRRLGYPRNSESVHNVAGRSPHSSSLSVSIPYQQPAPGGRFRSGSMLAHSPSNSTTIAPIPSFPSTVSSLSSFRQSGGVYPKYYPPSSLRIFALSKNWKNRFLILSSPATLVTRGQGPAVSYLHLFKSANPDDRELERIEINEDSVVFVAEEEVGGRRHVIKVGGVDVGAMRKEYTHEEGGHTMWLLQIADQAEAQTWITNIKNAILGQRTVRAGLIPAYTLGNNEPRGDMDVMLSIRAQGLITSPTSSTTKLPPASSPVNVPFGETNPNYASSISSHSMRSQTTVLKPASPVGAVSTLKGLFANSSRPRSASRAASVHSERQQDRDGNEESFTSMGSNLLSMLRSNAPTDAQSVVTISSMPVPRTNLPFSGPVGPIDRRIDRKILSERQPIQWASTEPTSLNKDRANRALSLGALSLQPPPRKRWTSVDPTNASANKDPQTEKQTNGSGQRTGFSASRASTDRAETEPPSSPSHLSGFHFGTPEQRPRAPSLQSVSTFASGENGFSIERSSSSTKRSSGTRSARRWSRQGILPSRMTPPSEPPPAIPTNQLTQGLHPYAAERAPSPVSSEGSEKSIISGLPNFSKRASGSSVHSANSASAAQSHTGPTSTIATFNTALIAIRTPATHRTSMPPPRPPPTSALPPAPIPIEGNQDEVSQDTLKPLETIPASSKSSFRNSVAHRTFRLSAIAPKPPPSTTLPPCPDEPDYRSHRRSSSSSGSNANGLNLYPAKLESIPASPASPIPPITASNPFPPPLGPLPPTPPIAPSSTQAMPPPKRTISIKQRLRILSTPPTSGNQAPAKLQLSHSVTTASATAPPLLTTSPPGTPIAEKITMFQNDPSFLQMHTPVLPSLPPPQALLSSQSQEVAEVTSLSPPPRRGSKQLLETELDATKNGLVLMEDQLSTVDEPRHFSLSRPGSAISLKSPGSQILLEGDLESPKEATSPEDPEEKLPSPLEPRHLTLSRPGSVISLGIMSI